MLRQMETLGRIGTDRVEILGHAYGTFGREVFTTSGFPSGSPIPGGRFVVDCPMYIMGMNTVSGSRMHRAVILPDRDGTHLFRNDRTTDFSSIIDAVKDENGLFHFIGVSGNGMNTCKDKCTVAPCCPIGYEDVYQRTNYHPLFGDALSIVISGMVYVYTESPINPMDVVHVRTKIIDNGKHPCQLLGGITAFPDEGTQPAGSNIRVETSAAAGESVLIQIGGMKNV